MYLPIKNSTMYHRNLPLLHHLASDYNEIINATNATFRPEEFRCVNGGDTTSYSANHDDDDEIDFELEEVEDQMLLLLSFGSKKRKLDSIAHRPKKRKKKYDTKKMYFTNPFTMQREVFTFQHSIWYCNYITDPSPEREKWSRLFRLRFRMPYNSFLDLVNQCMESTYFCRWTNNSINPYNKQPVLPLGLLVLSALRYLGRGWTFDDLQEATAISTETLRIFLHIFMEFGSSTLYNKYVVNPTSSMDIKDCEAEYSMAVFPGCIGSADASHVMMEVCSYRLRQLHLGYKLAHTARTYNITVNHRRRILNSTRGHPARFNDKTLILFDHLINQLHDGKFNDKHEFTLKDFDKNGTIIDVKYKGCYVIVDNGYLQRSTTVPPMKHCTKRSEIRFSEWLESLRKDVECTFGILKSRWRVLKSGIRTHGISSCDKIWLTCCALHNMLLEVDGLSAKWDEGVRSDWEDSDEIPNAVNKLNNPSSIRNFDLARSGYGNDYEPSNDEVMVDDEEEPTLPIPQNDDESFNVCDLSLTQFRKRLITHFNILFKQNKIIWPRRNNGL